MGCDYYIEKNLYIYYNDNSFNYINLKRDRVYYSDIINHDFSMSIKSPDSNLSELEKIKQYILIPKKLPFLVFSNDTFTNFYVCNKFKKMVEYEMKNNQNNQNKTWNDVKDIVILEERCI